MISIKSGYGAIARGMAAVLRAVASRGCCIGLIRWRLFLVSCWLVLRVRFFFFCHPNIIASLPYLLASSCTTPECDLRPLARPPGLTLDVRPFPGWHHSFLHLYFSNPIFHLHPLAYHSNCHFHLPHRPHYDRRDDNCDCYVHHFQGSYP